MRERSRRARRSAISINFAREGEKTTFARVKREERVSRGRVSSGRIVAARGRRIVARTMWNEFAPRLEPLFPPLSLSLSPRISPPPFNPFFSIYACLAAHPPPISTVPPSIWLHFTWNSHVSRVHSREKKEKKKEKERKGKGGGWCVQASVSEGCRSKEGEEGGRNSFLFAYCLSLFIRELPFDTGVICIQKLAGNHRRDLLPSFLPACLARVASPPGNRRHPQPITIFETEWRFQLPSFRRDVSRRINLGFSLITLQVFLFFGKYFGGGGKIYREVIR